MGKSTTAKRERPIRNYIICEKCEAHVAKDSTSCHACGCTKFLPEFIYKRKGVSRNFSINVVESFKDPDVKVLNFYKWFPGKRWSINIATLADWNKIKQVVDEELGPYIGWDTKTKLDELLSKEIRTAKQNKITDMASVSKIPQFLLEITKSIDFKNIGEESQKHVFDGLRTLVEIAEKYDKGFQVTFNEVLAKLPNEGKVALAQLEELMKKWSLKQITGVAAVVQERLNEIERFIKAVKSDKTFEIRGNNSIHRILERSMWIVDERYWLMHSNETLRGFIGEGMVKRDKKRYGKKRPDFVCGSVDNKLIILELKKPSHKLIDDDLEQLETYLMVVEDYTDKYASYEAYLVGKRIDPELRRRLKFRKNTFKVLTYSDLVDNTETRYQEYLKLVRVNKRK